MNSPTPNQPPNRGSSIILWIGIVLLLVTLGLGIYALVANLTLTFSIISFVLALLAIPIGILQINPKLLDQVRQTLKMGLRVIEALKKGLPVIGILLLIASITLNAYLAYLLIHSWSSPPLSHLTPTPVRTAILSSPSVATDSPTITTPTPLKTLQTLCNAAKAEDYQTQWNQFDTGYASGNWGNESMYASDLKNRDNSHSGVANCTVTKVAQNDSSASGTVTTTFGDGTIDTKTFQLTKEGDGIWRINGIA